MQERKPSNVWLARNSLPNDNTPDDKNFLTLTAHKVKKNHISLDQIELRYSKEYAEYIIDFKLVHIKNIIFHMIG